ncbi:MAG: serine esterase, partial [Planctomycetota bacterium]
FEWLPSALGIDGLDYLLVDAPDPYYGGYSWYDVPPDQGPGIHRSRALLDGLFVEILANGYEPPHLGLFGFSQGCLMTLDWGGRSNLALAAYVGVSGYCWQPNELAAELSASAKRPVWLVTHGRFDELLPLQVTRAQVDTLIAAGLPVQFAVYDKGHTIDPHEELPHLRRFLAERLG